MSTREPSFPFNHFGPDGKFRTNPALNIGPEEMAKMEEEEQIALLEGDDYYLNCPVCHSPYDSSMNLIEDEFNLYEHLLIDHEILGAHQVQLGYISSQTFTDMEGEDS